MLLQCRKESRSLSSRSDRLTVTPKEITFGTVTYQIDYGMGFPTMAQPYTVTFNTDGLRVGRHLLRMFIGVWAVDYSPANAIVSYYLDITEPEPDDTTPGGDETNPDGGSSCCGGGPPKCKARMMIKFHKV